MKKDSKTIKNYKHSTPMRIIIANATAILLAALQLAPWEPPPPPPQQDGACRQTSAAAYLRHCLGSLGFRRRGEVGEEGEKRKMNGESLSLCVNKNSREAGG